MTNNDGWGTPVPANNIMLQTQNAAQEMAKVAETLVNDGWTQTAHDEFTKTVSTQEALTDWGGDSVAWGAPLTPVTTLDDTRELPEDWMHREADAAQYAGVKEPWPEFVARNYDDDGLGNLTAKREYVEGPDAWPVNPEDAGDGEPRDMMDEPEFGTYGASDDERARAANACMSIDPQTPWVVDVPDGELTLKEDYMPTVTMGEETGVYVAYSQGVLHAVLAGPYPDVAAARLKLDEVWRRFEADPAMPHAFTKSDWNRAGLYMAEIPLKARRKGAYGAI